MPASCEWPWILEKNNNGPLFLKGDLINLKSSCEEHFPQGAILHAERNFLLFKDQLVESGCQKKKEPIVPLGKLVVLWALLACRIGRIVLFSSRIDCSDSRIDCSDSRIDCSDLISSLLMSCSIRFWKAKIVYDVMLFIFKRRTICYV